MRNMRTSKAVFALRFAVLLAGLAAPAAKANYFHDPASGITRMIGSAPNPTANDVRGVYPVISQSLNEHGDVELKLSLTEKGTVSDAVVEKSSGSPRLDEAAIKYVKTYWSYEPPDGQEMPAQMLFTVSFVLK